MRRIAAVLAVLAFALVACGGDEPPPGAGAPPTTSPEPTGALASFLVYSTTANCPSSACTAAEWSTDRKDDLWIYEIDGSSHYRLTSDGSNRVEVLPQFTGRGKISFIEGDDEQKPGVALFEVGVARGENAKELFRAEKGNIFRYDWHPDGGSVAFLEFDDEGASALRIWTRVDGKIRTVKSFPKLLGRGVGQDDEVSVAWSPDGKRILVVDTFRDPPLKVTMWILDLNGKDVVPPRAGTFGRWAGDSAAVYYREWAGNGDWFRLTLADERTRLDIPAQRYNPALSPDGRLLALNSGGGKPTVSVFDLTTGKERTLGAGVGPLWLSDGAVVVTDVRPCTAADECFEAPPWKPVGTASKLTLAGDKPEVLFPGWTLNADVRLI